MVRHEVAGRTTLTTRAETMPMQMTSWLMLPRAPRTPRRSNLHRVYPLNSVHALTGGLRIATAMQRTESQKDDRGVPPGRTWCATRWQAGQH